MATYPVPVLHFDTFNDAKAAVNDEGHPYLGTTGRRGWGFFPWVVVNYLGPDDQSLRVIDSYAVYDENGVLVTPEQLASGWFCGVGVPVGDIPSTLAQNLSDGAAAVDAAVAVEPGLAGQQLAVLIQHGGNVA